MKGYLLKETSIEIGEGSMIESQAAEYPFVVLFEDDKDTGYFYAAERDAGGAYVILDMVFIYDAEVIPAAKRKVKLAVIWSTDWQRCGLILDNTCHAVFDFQNKAGYNITGFPAPILWSGHDRILTNKLVKKFFG